MRTATVQWAVSVEGSDREELYDAPHEAEGAYERAREREPALRRVFLERVETTVERTLVDYSGPRMEVAPYDAGERRAWMVADWMGRMMVMIPAYTIGLIRGGLIAYVLMR
jgi:hypothetical protein